MDIANNQMLLKRPVNVKAIVTPRWKDEVQQQLQAKINAINSQLSQLKIQGQRALGLNKFDFRAQARSLRGYLLYQEKNTMILPAPKTTVYLVRVSFVAALLLLLNISGCRSTNVTDAQGRVKLLVPASYLNSDGCPNPQDIDLINKQGKPLKVKRVEKQANGSCAVITK